MSLPVINKTILLFCDLPS